MENTSDELIKIARSGSGLIDPRGKPYSVSSLGHVDFLLRQPKYKDYAKRIKQANSDEWSILYRAVMDDALRNGWIRIIGSEFEVGINGRQNIIKKHKKLIDDIVLFIGSVKKRNMNIRWDFVK